MREKAARWLGLSKDDATQHDTMLAGREPDDMTVVINTIYFFYSWPNDLDAKVRARLNARRHKNVTKVMYVEILNQMLQDKLTWPAMLEDLSACRLRPEVRIHGPPPGMGVVYLDIKRLNALIEIVFDEISPTEILLLIDLVYFSQKAMQELHDNYPKLLFRQSIRRLQVSRSDSRQCERDYFKVASPLG